MPDYTYICEDGHELTIEEPMIMEIERNCVRCNKRMWRKPGMPNVNWGGLKPSQGDRAPLIQDMIDNEVENRDHYIRDKENRQ